LYARGQVNRLWKTERGSFLCSGYSIFVFGKSFRLCLSLISCSIDAASRLGLRRSWFRDACRHVDVFSQALILRASRILDPKFDSVVVSRGLLMILAVRVRCCLSIHQRNRIQTTNGRRVRHRLNSWKRSMLMPSIHQMKCEQSLARKLDYL
jgi:hypothetical protein